MRTVRYFLLITSCLALLLPVATAQISFGVKAGANLAQQNIQDLDLEVDSDEITGYTWGAIVEIAINNSIYLQPEVLLIQKGGELTLPKIKTTMNYIDIPILLKLKLLNSNLLNINVLGGPSFGYATSGEMLQDNSIVKINFGEDNIQRFDLGAQAGAGVGINLGSVGVFGDARYLFGISDVDGSADKSIKNKGLTVSAGLLFRIVGR